MRVHDKKMDEYSVSFRKLGAAHYHGRDEAGPRGAAACRFFISTPNLDTGR